MMAIWRPDRITLTVFEITRLFPTPYVVIKWHSVLHTIRRKPVEPPRANEVQNSLFFCHTFYFNTLELTFPLYFFQGMDMNFCTLIVHYHLKGSSFLLLHFKYIISPWKKDNFKFNLKVDILLACNFGQILSFGPKF